MNLRVVFRALIGSTLAVMMIMRWSGSRMSVRVYSVFHGWFGISVLLFGAFGLFSAWRALREPQNRSALLTDVVLAAAWLPYWFANYR